MAQKSSGKSQGRSRPQAQSKNQGRGAQQKQNPDSGRGGGGAGGRGAANGTASRANSGGSRQKGRSGRGSEDRDQSQQAGVAGKVGDTLKEHPITAAALGAGLTLLAAQGLRMAIGGRNSAGGGESEENSPEGSRSDEGGEEDEEDADSRDASASGGEDEEDEDGEGGGGGFAGRLRQGASSLGSKFGQAFRGSGDAIKRGAKSGFERGRDGAEQSWTNHPLFMCGVALAVGTAAGFLLPSTRQEDRLMGETSDKVAGRFKKGGTEAFHQGRSIAGRVLHEAVSASARETEREGLTPDRLGKKFKRVFNNVREAVAEAVQED